MPHLHCGVAGADVRRACTCRAEMSGVDFMQASAKKKEEEERLRAEAAAKKKEEEVEG